MENIKSWMNKNWGYVLVGILPFILWIMNFHSQHISDKGSDWSNFGGFLSGIYSPILTGGTLWILLKQFQFQKNLDNEQKIRAASDDLHRRADQCLNMMRLMFEEKKSEYLLREKNISPYFPSSNVLDPYNEFLIDIQNYKLTIKMVNENQVVDNTLIAVFISSSDVFFEILDELKEKSELLHTYNRIMSDASIYFPFAFLVKVEEKITITIEKKIERGEEPHFQGFRYNALKGLKTMKSK